MNCLCNAHGEIETDRFRSILTTFVASAKLWAISIAVNIQQCTWLNKDRSFRSILTTFVASAQIWAKNISVNSNAHGEIKTDHFRSILTTYVASAQLWAINIVNNTHDI